MVYLSKTISAEWEKHQDKVEYWLKYVKLFHSSGKFQ